MCAYFYVPFLVVCNSNKLNEAITCYSLISFIAAY